VTIFLVNIKKDGRHAALLSTHDSELVHNVLPNALADAGYTMEIDDAPSPLARAQTA
jgi:hypothetical protein